MISIETHKIAQLVAGELKDALGARWLKLKAAAAYSAIGKTRLKQLAKSGAVVGFPDPESKRRDWIFDKNSLDEYRIGQSGAGFVKQKTLAILK